MKLPVFTRILLCIAFALLMSCIGDDSPVSTDGNKPPPNEPAPRDSLPPPGINDLTIAYSTTENELMLEWTTPHDDSLSESISRYEIRCMARSPFSWNKAVPVIDPPLPGLPGAEERYRFVSFNSGDSLFCAIRSMDEDGNVSPVSNVASMKIPGYGFEGICRDLFSASPAAGLRVVFIAARTDSFITGSEGEFRTYDLAPQRVRVRISGSAAESTYHDIDHAFDLMTHAKQQYPMFPVRFTKRNPLVSYLRLFREATEPCKGDTPILLKWAKRPVAIFIPQFTNGYGIDYHAAGVAAAQRWMDRSGIELFSFVDSPPDVGVVMNFKTREEMGGLIGITRHTFGPDGLPSMDDVDIVDAFNDAKNLYRIMLHELGHTIRLCHLPWRDYIMYPGQPLPDDITDDETMLVRIHEALPNRIDMSMFIDEVP